ncbi:MAG: glycerate kinase [Roseinatronobacter sp.]
MTLSADAMRDLFLVGVQAADPRGAVRAALLAQPVRPVGRLFMLAVGKAACAMAEAALPLLPQPARALVVTNPENAVNVPGADLWLAAHPVPDDGGLRAGQAVLDMLAATRDADEVLVLVSGGGSALLPAPVEGLTLADKATVNRLLLGAGLDIVQMNMVRQHLSRLKGGGLLRAAAPASVRALILSDVVGDDLRAIASGPTVAPIAPRAQVCAMLRDLGLWEQLPEAARVALGRPEDPLALPPARNLLIGSNALSVAAMARACPGARVAPAPLVGDVAQAARAIVALVADGPGTTLLGGETTVTLHGTGLGGRNQELALRVAFALDGRSGWRFLSAGTDGRDGPTDAAGALVDGGTIARIRAAGGDAEALLANNDSYAALRLSGALLITGGTGTNVADLQILCVDA